MKRSLLTGVLAGFIACAFIAFSCRPDNPEPNPEPNPNPDPVPTTGKTVVEVDDQGRLLKLPMPIIPFTAHVKDMQEAEQKLGATSMGDPSASGKYRIYSYKANDPAGLSIARSYIFGENGTGFLEMAGATFKASLLYNEEHKFLPEVKKLLTSDGWEWQGQNADGDELFQKEYLSIEISYSSQSNYAQIIYIPDLNNLPPSKTFYPQVKDFPFTAQYLNKTTKEQIKAYEDQLGLRTLAKEDEVSLTYRIKSGAEGNLELVRYQLVPTEGSGGTTLAANLYCSGSALNKEMLQNNADVAKWFALNGFNNYTTDGAYGYAANTYFRVTALADQPGSFTLFFQPNQEGTTDPLLQRYFFLPYDKPGESYKENGPVWKFEQERGMEVSVEKEDGLDTHYLRAAHPHRGKAITAVNYYTTEVDYVYDYAVISFDFSFPLDGKEKELADFLTKEGYEFVGEEPYESDYSITTYKWYWYNKAKGLLLELNKQEGTETFKFLEGLLSKDDMPELTRRNLPANRTQAQLRRMNLLRR